MLTAWLLSCLHSKLQQCPRLAILSRTHWRKLFTQCMWHLSQLSKHEKAVCFSLQTHFVHLSVIFISQDSLCPKVQDIRPVSYLCAPSSSISPTIYLSINQSFSRSIQLTGHFKAATGIIVLFCDHCVKALDQRWTSALPTYYKTCPLLLCLSFGVGIHGRSEWRDGGGGCYIRGAVSANGLLFTPVNLLAGG